MEVERRKERPSEGKGKGGEREYTGVEYVGIIFWPWWCNFLLLWIELAKRRTKKTLHSNSSKVIDLMNCTMTLILLAIWCIDKLMRSVRYCQWKLENTSNEHQIFFSLKKHSCCERRPIFSIAFSIDLLNPESSPKFHAPLTLTSNGRLERWLTEAFVRKVLISKL